MLWCVHPQVVSPGVPAEGMDVDEGDEEVEGGDSPVIKIQPEQ